MEIKERRIVELFLGLIFVVLLILLIFVVFNLDSEKSASSNVVQNSYNTNIYNYASEKNYIKQNPERSGYLKYSSYGEHFRDKDYFNNYREEFIVYVVNKDFEAGYFEVEFNFCDHERVCFSRTIEKYILPGQEKQFRYFDLAESKYEYFSWRYEVHSEVA